MHKIYNIMQLFFFVFRCLKMLLKLYQCKYTLISCISRMACLMPSPCYTFTSPAYWKWILHDVIVPGFKHGCHNDMMFISDQCEQLSSLSTNVLQLTGVGLLGIRLSGCVTDCHVLSPGVMLVCICSVHSKRAKIATS